MACGAGLVAYSCGGSRGWAVKVTASRVPVSALSGHRRMGGSYAERPRRVQGHEVFRRRPSRFGPMARAHHLTDAQGVTAGVERVLRAAARAHKETGAPISTHTHAGTERGLEQLEIFTQEGVDFSKVVIGHSGDTTDLNYLRRVLDHGVMIGMDRFGLDLILDFTSRVDTVAALVAEGFADQIVLSHDASVYTQNFDIEAKATLLPNWHYEHIHRDVLPALTERGVTADQIEQMLVRNPGRILG